VAPDARLIYIVGDPIRKFTGTYREGISIGAEKRSVAEALASVDDPTQDRYLVGCKFGQQLAHYLEHFPAEQTLVVDQDESQLEFLNKRLRADMALLRSLTTPELGAGWQV
jgi:hypothetical protein